MTTEYLLLGIENPLLDISAPVSKDLLVKYKLKANDAILADPSHKDLYAEFIANYPVKYIAAGAAQNTMRGAQYLLPPKSTVYLGCVGNDENAKILKHSATADGLETLYQVSETVPTGKCAVLITDNNRSMVSLPYIRSPISSLPTSSKSNTSRNQKSGPQSLHPRTTTSVDIL
jgi:adenosine kinase